MFGEEIFVVGANLCEQVYGTYKIIATCIEGATALPAQNNTCVTHASLKQGQSVLCYSLLPGSSLEGKEATKF